MSDSRFLRISLAAIAVILALLIIRTAKAVLFPFVLAVFLTYLLDPLLEFAARLRVPKGLAVAGLLVLVFAFVYFLCVGIYEGGRSLAEVLPKYGPRISELGARISGLVRSLRPAVPAAASAASPASAAGPDLGKIAGWVGQGLGSFFNLAAKLFILFLFTLVMVVGRGRGLAKLASALPPSTASGAVAAVRQINVQVRKYLVIKTLMGLINGLTVWLVCAAFKVDFALLFGILAFVLNYIPSVGSLVSAVIRVGFAYFQFGNFWVPLWILVITSGADTLMGNLVEPKIMGSGLGLSPLVIIFSLVFWGWMWGIAGMIIAVPVTAVLKIACNNIPALRPVAVLME